MKIRPAFINMTKEDVAKLEGFGKNVYTYRGELKKRRKGWKRSETPKCVTFTCDTCCNVVSVEFYRLKTPNEWAVMVYYPDLEQFSEWFPPLAPLGFMK